MLRCAIFCNVIDNFGDIGICWRLARQLAHEYPLDVTLFVDDLASFAVLAPAIQAEKPVQQLEQITVRHWHPKLTFEQTYELVIEGFGCRLSAQMIDQMDQQSKMGQPPHWINLEYLSAETWAIDCHGMTSIHPTTGLKQTFWFPSVTEKSGGLIREAGLTAEREQFQQSDVEQKFFWHALGIDNALTYTKRISLFSYENQAMVAFLAALEESEESTLLVVPKSKSLPDIERWLGVSLQVGDQVKRGQLTVVVLPFLSQMQYDRLLWACDLNFIRGEDSCVRAQWASRPFIWHIYPQDEQAHLIKLQAWIDQVEQHAGAIPSWHLAMHAWNEAAPIDMQGWKLMLKDLALWKSQANVWSNYLTQQSDLVTRLMVWMNKQH